MAKRKGAAPLPGRVWVKVIDGLAVYACNYYEPGEPPHVGWSRYRLDDPKPKRRKAVRGG